MTTQQQVAPGSYFGLPGYTQPMEQFDDLTGINTVLGLSNQTPSTRRACSRRPT